MQLEARPYDLIDLADSHQRETTQPAMDCQNMHTIKRRVDESRQSTLNREASAYQIAHQATDGRKAAERYKRSMVAIDKIEEGLAGGDPQKISLASALVV